MHENLDEFEFRKICNRVMALGPLIGQKLVFAQYLKKTNGQIETKVCIHSIIDKIYLGIVNHCFSQSCNRVTALD